jgi:hypothetical protein
VATHPLPDGHSVEIERMADQVYWHIRIEGDQAGEIVGTPLTSTLAELLGYQVAHQEWPRWIDDLASEVEAAFGGH